VTPAESDFVRRIFFIGYQELSGIVRALTIIFIIIAVRNISIQG